MRRLLVTLLLVTGLGFAPAKAHAQVSIWLMKGVSGVGVGASVSGNSDSMTFGLGGGYSYQGYIEGDLGVGYTTFSDKNALASDLKAVAITPGFQYHPLKQGPDMPISLSLGVTYTQNVFSSNELKNSAIEMAGWASALNAGVYRFFRLGSNTGIIPAAGIAYGHSELTLKGPGGQKTNSSDDFGVALGAYFAYIDDGGRIYGLIPTVNIVLTNDTSVTFGLELSVNWSLL